MTGRKYPRRTGGSGTDSTSRAAGAGSGESGSSRRSGSAQDQDPAARARDICYRLLAMRDHTRLELEQGLHKREIPRRSRRRSWPSSTRRG
ncbi:hypothetical protein ACOBQX_25060 [Actinokineospora sp. G85]|uniref:hypothetical protein n=1 Tax=Actinokineospora sp. G85 TaxID=3406626 RepID=UPI003C73905D